VHTPKHTKYRNNIIVDFCLTLIKLYFIDVSIHSKCYFFNTHFTTQLIDKDFITN
jgi:hypothetical protein